MSVGRDDDVRVEGIRLGLELALLRLGRCRSLKQAWAALSFASVRAASARGDARTRRELMQEIHRPVLRNAR